MQVAFHLGVHATDGERLMRTLMNNRESLIRQGIDVVAPIRHRGLFEETLMALHGPDPAGCHS
jgi:hypothetical protein